MMQKFKRIMSKIQPKTAASFLWGLKILRGYRLLSLPTNPPPTSQIIVVCVSSGHICNPSPLLAHYYHRAAFCLPSRAQASWRWGGGKQGNKVGQGSKGKTLRLAAKNPKNTESQNTRCCSAPALREERSRRFPSKVWSISSSWVSST